MSKKKVILVVAGVVALFLLLFAGYKLYDGISKFSEAERKLNVSMGTLRRYYTMEPFPSEDNIKIEDANIKTLDEWCKTLVASLKKGEVDQDKRETSPSRFMKVLDSKKRDVEQKARGKKVKLAEEGAFAMGFDRYFMEGSVLPLPADVPRLMQQLNIIEMLCNILVDEGVDEITRVRREVFENIGDDDSGDAQAASSMRRKATSSRRGSRPGGAGESQDLFNKDAGIMGPDDWYAKLRFVLEFKAGESSFLAVLNHLAKDPMLAVVTSFSLEKQGQDIRMQSPEDKVKMSRSAKPVPSDDQAPAVPELQDTGLSRQQKLVSGLELEQPLSVVLNIEVYRFRGDEGK